MVAEARHRADTLEMITAINQCAEEAEQLRRKDARRREILRRKEAAERKDEEITKLALVFSLGGVTVSAVIAFLSLLSGTNPLQNFIF